MKRKAVDFSGDIPRIIVGYEGEATESILIDPGLNAVKGLPPHCWYLEDGRIVPGAPRDCETSSFVKTEKPIKEVEIKEVVVRETVKELQPQIFNNTIIKKEIPTNLYRLVFLHSIAIIAIIVWEIVR